MKKQKKSATQNEYLTGPKVWLFFALVMAIVLINYVVIFSPWDKIYQWVFIGTETAILFGVIGGLLGTLKRRK